MRRKKISIWILHGSSGVTFELTLPKLILGLLTITVVLSGAILTVRKSVVEAETTAAASASLLEQYLTQRLSEKDSRSHALLSDVLREKSSDLAAPSDENARIVDAKIKLLAEEFVRVRSYEKQLQSRASLLTSILDSIVDLDQGGILPGPVEPGGRDDQSGGEAARLGIGGGDAPVSPLFSRYRSLRAENDDGDGRNTLDEFDFQVDLLNSIPLGTPVYGVRSSGFGSRYSPFSGKYHQHSGVDIAVDRSSSVRATADAVVKHAGYKGAYGKLVVLDHGNGIETLYGHLSKIVVKEGQRVCRGQQVGLVGSSGRSTGPHLHYEVRFRGAPRNPEPFMQLAGLLRSFEVK